MNREQVWELFKKTGKVIYYLKYKTMCKEGE